MRIFNVGIREVLLLLVIMLILFGPNQLQENARKFARGIRRFVHSDTWRTFLGIYDDVNTIKDQVIRESGIQEVRDSLRGVNRDLQNFNTEMQQPLRNSDGETPDMPRPDISRPVNNLPSEIACENESESGSNEN